MVNNNDGSSNAANTNSNNSNTKRSKNKQINGSNSTSVAATTAVTNPEKPKQPQRGLGVAQLEKIRLHSQLANYGILPHHQVPHPGFFNPSFQHVPDFQIGPPQVPNFCYPSPSVPSSSYAFMLGMGDHMERARCNESQQSFNTARWNPSNNLRALPETLPNLHQPGMVTRHYLSLVEQENVKSNFESKISSSQNSETSETEEIDLDLKL